MQLFGASLPSYLLSVKNNADNGGSVSGSEYGRPCSGHAIGSTPPLLPMPLPPYSSRVAVQDFAPKAAARRADADNLAAAPGVKLQTTSTRFEVDFPLRR